MVHNNGNNNNNNNIGNVVNKEKKQRVYLESALFHQSKNQIAPIMAGRKQQHFDKSDYGIVYDNLKPMLMLGRMIGILPMSYVRRNTFRATTTWLTYSVLVFLLIISYIIYIKFDNVVLVRLAEGRFEEAVIDYLFTVYLIPIIACPFAWYESYGISKVFNDWVTFEKIYKKITGRVLPLRLGKKTILLVVTLPILSFSTMIVTHITMANFLVWKVLPYCFVNTLTYVIGGMWYIHCDAIGKVATILADDFEIVLRHIGPSGKVADYRSLWMLLSRISRDFGTSCCYVLIFLCLYLFLVITLTIYGLLSQIQQGFGIKDIGLTVTAVNSIALLYFICDEAHYASNSVRVYFQKKLLLVELSWMNEDAQHEITMFLRATEMNQTDMSLGGFFDVNRNLFKSLLATMVTYLVVLLQFQISIPEDGSMQRVNEQHTTISSVILNATTKS